MPQALSPIVNIVADRSSPENMAPEKGWQHDGVHLSLTRSHLFSPRAHWEISLFSEVWHERGSYRAEPLLSLNRGVTSTLLSPSHPESEAFWLPSEGIPLHEQWGVGEERSCMVSCDTGLSDFHNKACQNKM